MVLDEEPRDETPRDGDEPSFDARLQRLERIVTSLEEGDLELEPAIERYKEGVALLRGCRDLLAGYRAQIEELTGEAQAALRPDPDDPDGPGGGRA